MILQAPPQRQKQNKPVSFYSADFESQQQKQQPATPSSPSKYLIPSPA